MSCCQHNKRFLQQFNSVQSFTHISESWTIPENFCSWSLKIAFAIFWQHISCKSIRIQWSSLHQWPRLRTLNKLIVSFHVRVTIIYDIACIRLFNNTEAVILEIVDSLDIAFHFYQWQYCCSVVFNVESFKKLWFFTLCWVMSLIVCRYSTHSRNRRWNIIICHYYHCDNTGCCVL